MTKRSDKEYIRMGQILEGVFDSANPDRKRVYRTAFVKGIVAGVGSVIGATVVIALVLWLLSLFDQVPLIGPLSDSLQDTLQQR